MRKIDYVKCGDYLIPALMLGDEGTKLHRFIGKYGMLRETYLRNHRRGLYTSMLMTGRLENHVAEVSELASKRVNFMVEEMMKREGVTEALKATDQMRWVQLVNSFQAAAEEVVLREIIYK